MIVLQKINIAMITIKKAEQRDRQAYIEIEKEFCKYYRDSKFNEQLAPVAYEDIPEFYFTDCFNEALSGDKFFYVAESDGKIIGSIEAEIVEPYEKDLYRITKVGHINSIFVSQKYRNTGVGRLLMDEAMTWMKSKEVEMCTLGVVSGNNDAFAVYEKMGFKPERVKMWKRV